MDLSNAKEILKNYSILVVEDGEDYRNIMVKTFSKIFKNTYVASNGFEGLEKFNQFKPDIVISDLRMPEMNGNILIQTIKETSPNTPIIVVSGHNRLVPYNQKGDCFLEKPFKFNILLGTILNLLTREPKNNHVYPIGLD